MKYSSKITLALALLSIGFSCKKKTENDRQAITTEVFDSTGTFAYDLAFLKKHKDVVVLTSPDNKAAQALVVADYQGRVMTSTAGGDSGNSYGWINYKLINSGENQPHINAFGGEDRFWLSPEGGQFSVFFPKGQPFDFKNWQTPALIDTDRYEITSTTGYSVTFKKDAKITNYSGTEFSIGIERKITMLDNQSILSFAGSLDNVKSVGFESVNTITNQGRDWQPDQGVIGIWILGMFNPSEQTTIIAPFTKRYVSKPLLTDNYFGAIPADRLIVGDSAVFLKADGNFRSKIGLAPLSAKPVAGSYDAGKGILTLIEYDLNPKGDYLKATWETHQEPYKGDALNAYNDGPLEDGSQLGPFYELESSSSVRALKKGEQLVHTHRTYHFEGDFQTLDLIAQKLLGVSLDTVAETSKK
jgi:hypothetical protein